MRQCVCVSECMRDRVKGTGEGKHNEKVRRDTVLINEEAEAERGIGGEKQKQVRASSGCIDRTTESFQGSLSGF